MSDKKLEQHRISLLMDGFRKITSLEDRLTMFKERIDELQDPLISSIFKNCIRVEKNDADGSIVFLFPNKFRFFKSWLHQGENLWISSATRIFDCNSDLDYQFIESDKEAIARDVPEENKKQIDLLRAKCDQFSHDWANVFIALFRDLKPENAYALLIIVDRLLMYNGIHYFVEITSDMLMLHFGLIEDEGTNRTLVGYDLPKNLEPDNKDYFVLRKVIDAIGHIGDIGKINEIEESEELEN